MFFCAALVILMIIKVSDLYENLYLVVHVLQEQMFVCARTEYFHPLQPLIGLVLKFDIYIYIYIYICTIVQCFLFFLKMVLFRRIDMY